MNLSHDFAEIKKHSNIVRLGGIAILITLIIHIIVNWVLKTFPPMNASVDELKSYLTHEYSIWAAVHGLRYMAIVCIILFSAGLFTRTCCIRSTTNIGWGIVGLLGSSLLVANLLITNGIETLAFLDYKILSENQELFWLLFNVTRVLFTAEIVAWAIVLTGFGVAGLYSKTIPKWVVYLGFLGAGSGLFAALNIVEVMNDGWQSYFLAAGGLLGMLWFATIGVYILIKGIK